MKFNTDFRKIFKSKLKLKLFFLFNMPMGVINGLKIEYFDNLKASVSVPFNYFTKNPFRSIYFAVQSMAAELSTAVLILNTISKLQRPFSMLVLNMKAEFVKKARSRVVFTCKQGQQIEKILTDALKENEPKTIDVQTVGVDEDGDIVSKFYFIWTIKPKS